MTRPLQSDDPLASLLTPAPAGPGFGVELRSGTVLFWSTANGNHDIRLDGITRSNLPMLASIDFTKDWTGQTAAVLVTRDANGLATYGLLGFFVKPPRS